MNPKIFPPLLVMILCAFSVCRGQERRSIEISESDTVWLKPTRVLVSIDANSPVPEGYSSGEVRVPVKKEPPKKPGALLAELRAARFSADMDTAVYYSDIFSVKDYPEVIVNLPSESEYNRLIQVLSPITGVSKKIFRVDFEGAPDRQSVYGRLYRKALSDGLSLASISGNSLGQVITIEEPKDLFSSIVEYLKEPGSIPIHDIYFVYGSALSKPYISRLLFRFELK